MVPILVSRRFRGDIYHLESESAENHDHYACSNDNLTYLVEERQCVNDQDLLNSKCFDIVIQYIP